MYKWALANVIFILCQWLKKTWSYFKALVALFQWSFGVLLWELLSRGLSPYDDVDNSDLKEYINQGYRLSQPKDTPYNV